MSFAEHSLVIYSCCKVITDYSYWVVKNYSGLYRGLCI